MSEIFVTANKNFALNSLESELIVQEATFFTWKDKHRCHKGLLGMVFKIQRSRTSTKMNLGPRQIFVISFFMLMDFSR